MATTVWAAAPANDRFNNRIGLSGTNITTSGTNSGASKENGEPAHAGNAGGRSVWWSWIAPSDGEVSVRTDGSSFDTLLGVYVGTSVSALSAIASNDDHSVLVTSRVRFPVTAGTQYQIAVDGFNESGTISTGEIALGLVFSSGFTRPANDPYADRQSISGAPRTIFATNAFATREVGEPLHANKEGETSVWWQWSPQTNGVYQVDTAGSSFDTLLAIYEGDSLAALRLLIANDDADVAGGIQSSRVFLSAGPSHTYMIAVDGFDGASGAVQLNIIPIDVRLESIGLNPDGAFELKVFGPPGGSLIIQASTNLADWEPLETVVATNGTMGFLDFATNFPLRFYRSELLVP